MHTGEANNLLRYYIISNRYTFLSTAKNLAAMIGDILIVQCPALKHSSLELSDKIILIIKSPPSGSVAGFILVFLDANNNLP